jgi:hypothetical protein
VQVTVDGQGGREITDWRTGEVLRRDPGGYDRYESALEELGQVLHGDQVNSTGLWAEELDAAEAEQAHFAGFVPDVPEHWPDKGQIQPCKQEVTAV